LRWTLSVTRLTVKHHSLILEYHSVTVGPLLS